jgi:hypothetical protein
MNRQLPESLEFVAFLGVLARPLILTTILFGLWRRRHPLECIRLGTR